MEVYQCNTLMFGAASMHAYAMIWVIAQVVK